jgi:nucleotide-binding universal stress UspA family protein
MDSEDRHGCRGKGKINLTALKANLNIYSIKTILMKTMIVPTDFSPISINAANYAAEMARSINADLSLLHICLLPTTYSEGPYPIEDIDSLMNGAEEQIIQLKNNLVHRTDRRIAIDTEVRAAATVSGELANYCKLKKPYAVVMGTQGSSAIERVFFGSNTTNAIKHLAWPVIVVPPEAKFTSIKKIGLACDLKKVDESIPFSQIRSLVKQFNAELYILHINSEGEKGFTAEKTIESRALQNMLDDLHPFYRFIDYDQIEDGLEEFAETNKLDLLITVPKRHNIIDKIFHKSHSKKLVMQTHVPVMAIHD